LKFFLSETMLLPDVRVSFGPVKLLDHVESTLMRVSFKPRLDKKNPHYFLTNNRTLKIFLNSV